MKIARRLQHVKRSEIRSIFETAPADAINLGLGEIHFPTPDLILDAGHKVLEGKYINYTPNAGLPELCQTIARYYDNRIPRNNICVTNGTEEALFAAVQALVDPGDEVLLADPCFVAYETVVRLAGGIPVFFDLQSNMNFSIDRDSLQKALSPRTKLILLCNPSNPLSICFTSSEIDFLVKISTENSLYLLVDEIYRDLYYDIRPETFLNYYDRAVIVSGLSKSHCMTGWRIGWAAAHDPELMHAITNAHQYISTCASLISQKAAIRALSPDGMKSVTILRKILKKQKKKLVTFLKELFPALQYIDPQAAPYLFLSWNRDDHLISDLLAKNGIIVIPGSAFGKNGSNWIRMNYAINDDKMKLLFKKLSAMSLILK